MSTLVSKEKPPIKDSQGGVDRRDTEGQRLGQKARGPVGPREALRAGAATHEWGTRPLRGARSLPSPPESLCEFGREVGRCQEHLAATHVAEVDFGWGECSRDGRDVGVWPLVIWLPGSAGAGRGGRPQDHSADEAASPRLPQRRAVSVFHQGAGTHTGPAER